MLLVLKRTVSMSTQNIGYINICRVRTFSQLYIQIFAYFDLYVGLGFERCNNVYDKTCYDMQNYS